VVFDPHWALLWPAGEAAGCVAAARLACDLQQPEFFSPSDDARPALPAQLDFFSPSADASDASDLQQPLLAPAPAGWVAEASFAVLDDLQHPAAFSPSAAANEASDLQQPLFFSPSADARLALAAQLDFFSPSAAAKLALPEQQPLLASTAAG
jgi:hypothetical protein